MSKKALLMILDGWGIGDQGKDDVIFNTPTPYWDSLLAAYPHSELQAIGENVCLTETVDNQRGTGTAVYKGQEWTARASEDGKRYEAGTIVKVKEIRGVTMYVTESGLMPQVPTTPQTEQEAE